MIVTAPPTEMLDGNEATARIAHRLNEVILIYPITPATPMGEAADGWSSRGETNLWGHVPRVVQMQSEAGAAGALHGALQTGALATTFTASQGLLLMLPNLYKLAGELTPVVIHVAARALATHALSIFGDHSDVMAARATGCALLASATVQEAHDMALVAQVAAWQSRLPFLHFFDGFRTSHEMAKIKLLDDEALRAMLPQAAIDAHRRRALSPDHPLLRGTAQNPDVFFQGREAANPFYDACPDIVACTLQHLAQHVGRRYDLFEYYGDPDADRVLILMGSATETAAETVDALIEQGQRVGLVKVRLYRPFDAQRLAAALPATTQAIAVLDRTKEPGSFGEPLYLDCVAALAEAYRQSWPAPRQVPTIIGGRYGLGSKEFTPAMVRSVFRELNQPHPRHGFTVGIHDDLTHTSLTWTDLDDGEPDDVVRAVFYGLGSDGTVGANKNTIKIIGDSTPLFAQGYFVYDSKKAGAVTVSHLRFGPRPIRSAYLIQHPHLVACHQPEFLERFDLLADVVPGGTFLLNTPVPPEQVWDALPRTTQRHLCEKRLRWYVIDAGHVARDAGMGGRINIVMQVAFFAVSGVLPREEALDAIRNSIRKTYGAKGAAVVEKNLAAVEQAVAALHELPVPARVTAQRDLLSAVPPEAPPVVQQLLGPIMARRGDELPTSVLPADGTFPTGTACWEKRNLAAEIPVWDPQICIQCGKCVLVCPHAVIRSKAYDPAALAAAPPGFLSAPARDTAWKGLHYTLQVSPEDCTGCAICVDVCPVRNKSQSRLKAINMQPVAPLLDVERPRWDFFLRLPEPDRRSLELTSLHQQQTQTPLFEFSGACAGCGETPYLKLLSQLFGDRLLVANATGCSSIYGGNLPTTPWTKDAQGRGPAWCNSLFEDNAEFGLGFRLSIDTQRRAAEALLRQLATPIGDLLVAELLAPEARDEAGIYAQRQRVEELRRRLAAIPGDAARQLELWADLLVHKSVWIVGGDGWAYDIGFGGVDHVLASGEDVNLLVLDTEVYSNTGGQMSKSTPLGAVAKFAASGKNSPKKDLGLMAMTYGNVYVARVAFGARDEQTLRAFLEAEAYPGPSLIIAYSHCIAHGLHMPTALQSHKAAVDSGQWPLYRFHPDRAARGENPLHLDCRPPKLPLEQYLRRENRFQMLFQSQPDRARLLAAQAQRDVHQRRTLYEYLAAWTWHPAQQSASARTTTAALANSATDPRTGRSSLATDQVSPESAGEP